MTLLLTIAVITGVLLVGGFMLSRMPGKSFAGPAPPAVDSKLRLRLESHLTALAGDIGQRHIWRPEALTAAADYIATSFEKARLPVTEQVYRVDGVHCRNIITEIRGNSRPDEIIVVGAHYDTVPGTPGANDNGSGVALLLETAAALAGSQPRRTIRFVAFVNEEPPFFKTGRMGSVVYSQSLKRDITKVIGMFSLETVGHYDDRPNSQTFPLPLMRLFYPSRGDFIAFVGNFSSRPFLHRSLAAFRQHAELPSEGIAAPGWVAGVDWSDHWSFWQAGYPALMVTDTALYRYRHYHADSDTPEKLDYGAMARLTEGFTAMLRDLSGIAEKKHD